MRMHVHGIVCEDANAKSARRGKRGGTVLRFGKPRDRERTGALSVCSEGTVTRMSSQEAGLSYVQNKM